MAMGDLPHAIGYELEEAVRPFEISAIGGTRAEGTAAAVAALVLRALERRRTPRSGLAVGLDASLREMIEGQIEQERLRGGDPVASVRAMADEMNVARLFARTWSVAWDDAAEGEKAQ